MPPPLTSLPGRCCDANHARAPRRASVRAHHDPAGAAAHAADLKEALARFAADDFSETAEGITEVAATGDPRAATIIEALQAGRLLYTR